MHLAEVPVGFGIDGDPIISAQQLAQVRRGVVADAVYLAQPVIHRLCGMGGVFKPVEVEFTANDLPCKPDNSLGTVPDLATSFERAGSHRRER